MKVAIILCCLFAVALAAKSSGKSEAKPAESKADAAKAEAKADAKAAGKANVKANSKSSAAAVAAADAKEDSIQAPVEVMQPETKTNAENNENDLSAQEQEAKKNNVYAPVYDARPVSYGPTYNAPAPPAYRPPVSSYNSPNTYTVPQYVQNNAYQSGNNYNAPNYNAPNYNAPNYPANDCKKTAILRKINEQVSKALENSKTACANVELLSNIKSLVNLALLNNCNNGYKAEGQHQGKGAAAEGQAHAVEHLKKSFQSKSSSKKNSHSKPAKE